MLDYHVDDILELLLLLDLWKFYNLFYVSFVNINRVVLLFFFKPILFAICTSTFGARGSVVVMALCYKPEGRGFDTR
jgi:hypothetical protein